MEAPPVQFVTTSDGMSIAYTVTGEGPPLVFLPQHWSHVQLSWQPEVYGGWWTELSRRFQLILFDHRGNGMSTRGLSDDHSMQHYQRDLVAVMERVKPAPAVLLGTARGTHVAVQYALDYPENVAGLVLLQPGVSFSSWAAPAFYQQVAAQSWERFLSLFTSATNRQFFSQSVDQHDWLQELQAFSKSSIENALTRLRCPVLVLHQESPSFPRQESAKAAALANAKLILLPEPGTPMSGHPGAVREIERFVRDLTPDGVEPPSNRVEAPASPLSVREVEVLKLVAAGRSNQQIADDLAIALSTVAKHVSNILDKTGANNRAEATSYAHRNRLI